ncbi:metallophosphoesterase [Actinomadura meridiana]|uniref:Metallophosphoesterase n=1 Tax=Actinomadura meridiana TaxID=559626 RepID=A0ABP8BVA8_9ACTN
MFLFAQLSDTHLDGGDHRLERAARVMARVNDVPLDAVLITGDIVEDGEPAQYRQARKELRSPYPVLMCPGNHDARGPYREGLLDEPFDDGPINRAHKVSGVVFLMCDSTVPGKGRGFLDDETIGWLDRQLAAEPDAPTFVCFHHPPVTLNIPFVDRIRQFGEERLAETVARHPQIVAVLCGHAHTATATTFAGRPLLVAPGVVSTLRLPGEEGGVADYDAPPGLTFHVLHDDGLLTTHYRTV